MKIVTVIYHETPEHLKMARKTWDSVPEGVEIMGVFNKSYGNDLNNYPNNITYIENDENCLAKAWNMGLIEAFKTEDVVFVSGLDSICPEYGQWLEMVDLAESEPDIGLVAATPGNFSGDKLKNPMNVQVRHGDGSFSFFCITKKCFEDVGGFDERFKPAYFEDNNYLERLWKGGYIPQRMESVVYPHIVQGTLKHGINTQKNYPKFMQKNLNLFKKLHGKVPDHLPEDVRFD